MKLIIFLGNPGDEYAQTRHNFGWFFADFLAREYGENWNFDKKFNAEIFSRAVDGDKIIFAKPQTFYNDSGFSARAIADFYKISPTETLAIHDEMDLPIGTIRTRMGGEAAGNNGVKSLTAHLSTDKFARVRVGSGRAAGDETTKPKTADHIAHVLGKTTRNEQEILNKEAPIIQQIVENFARGNFEQTTYKKFNKTKNARH